MPTVVAAEGVVLDGVLDAAWRTWPSGLSRQAGRQWWAAQMKTSWGRRCQRVFALVDAGEVLASAVQLDLTAVCDGRAVRACGIGSVSASPSPREGDDRRLLVETLLERAAHSGADFGLYESPAGRDDRQAGAFDALEMCDVTLTVAQSPRHGAPMTTVRGGEPRDLDAIVAMGRQRADPFRFHLDRDADFVQHAVTTKRLLAGLGPAHARQLHFFIAEEGITAAAYVMMSVVGDSWTLEECGDRDPSGARVGALLQALIAREPVERRPEIRAWLPAGFCPPQVTLVPATSPPSTFIVRRLGSGAMRDPLVAGDVLFWRGDWVT